MRIRRRPNCPKDPEIPVPSDRPKRIIGAAVELQLLDSGAGGGEGGKPRLGAGDEGERPEIWAAAGEGPEAGVYGIGRKETVADGVGEGGIRVDGD